MENRTDEEIEREVLEELAQDARVARTSPDEIGVCVRAGVVTLAGRIDSYFKKWAAEEVAQDVHGVESVVNQIEVVVQPVARVVAGPTPEELRVKIEEALTRLAEAAAKNIEVVVEGTKAVLKGRVRSWAERDEAERAVWIAPGITQVEDLIQVSYA
ncbi:MAG: BON domain-containing protein [Deltaproteobacteria bacterium]|nr:BON domain-containing protein [Deltaproteobacteria bacterium]